LNRGLAPCRFSRPETGDGLQPDATICKNDARFSGSPIAERCPRCTRIGKKWGKAIQVSRRAGMARSRSDQEWACHSPGMYHERWRGRRVHRSNSGTVCSRRSQSGSAALPAEEPPSRQRVASDAALERVDKRLPRRWPFRHTSSRIGFPRRADRAEVFARRPARPGSNKNPAESFSPEFH
jgi:hypothetical protein